VIPASRIHGISKKLLEFYPEATSPGLVNNFLSFQDREIDKHQYTQRMDFLQSSKSVWMGRYSYANEGEITPNLKLNGTKLKANVHQAVVGNTLTLSPSLLNEARFGYNYFFNTFGRELAFERDVIKELGIPGISLNPPEAWGIPSISVTGFSGFGDSTEGPYTIRNHSFEFSDNLSWIRGRHSFKFGGTVRYDQFNQVGNQFARGNFQFPADRDRVRVRRLPARLRAADRVGRGARRDQIPGAEPRLLFCRHLEGPFEHDLRSRPALRVHAAMARQERHADERRYSVPRHEPNVQNRACHPTLVRIGSGDVYEGTVLRFAPNIQVARDGRLGDRLIFDDKKNFAPRRAGRGRRTTSGRTERAPASSTCRTPATRASTWRATFGPPPRQHAAADARPDARRAVPWRRQRERLRRGAAAGVPDQRLRARQHAESQDAVHVAVPVQRPARARRRRRRSRSATSARAAIASSGCSTGTKRFPA
jgi:hypothetical protein